MICVLLAVDEVNGTAGYATYTEQASRTAETIADSDSVMIAIRKYLTAPWQGTASQLLTVLTIDSPPKDWPTTPQAMGGRLVRAVPTLRMLGWTVERDRTGHRGSRNWIVVPPADPPELFPAQSSAMSAPSADGSADIADDADDLEHYPFEGPPQST